MKINIDNIDTDIGLEQARRAHYNVSFSPEKRGDRVVADYIAALTDLAAFIEETSKAPEQQAIAQQLFDDLRGKYRGKVLKWLGAKSRCISSAITGPAKFPVRRAEKANDAEHKRLGEMVHFYSNMKAYAFKTLSRAIPKVGAQENKTVRAGSIDIVLNYAENRLQIIFPGKPSDEARALLKANGFKWSPRFSAWQRQLTQNAENALKFRVLPAPEMAEYIKEAA